MKRNKPESLKTLIQQYIKFSGIDGALVAGRIYSAWDSVVGAKVVVATRSKHFSKGVLYCTISSSVVRTFLAYDIENIRNQINNQMGSEVVKRIILK